MKTPKGQDNWEKWELEVLLSGHKTKTADDLLKELPTRSRIAISQQACNRGVSLKKAAA